MGFFRSIHASSAGRSAPLRLGVCLVWLVFVSVTACGQVFQLTGGSSSMLNAYGGSLGMRANTYAARLDLGFVDRPSLGFSYLRPFRGSVLGAGDEQIPFLLPTDLFDHSFYTLGRGVSVLRKQKNGQLFVFAGTTANGLAAPFLNIARMDTASGMVFYERQLSSSLTFVSRNIVSRRQTSIQAIQWAPRKDTRMAMSAGLGNSQGYWASSYSIDKQAIGIDASYARHGETFQRILVATPQLAENDRENIRVRISPVSNFRVIVSRNNYLARAQDGSAIRAAVNGFGAWTSLADFQLYGSLFQSTTATNGSTAAAFGSRRAITRRLSVGGDYLFSSNRQGQSSRSFVGTLREVLSSRLSVNQVINHGNGRTNVAVGGSLLSNFVTVSVDYQTVFLPFLAGGAGQFKQVIAFGLHFQLPYGVQFNTETNVSALGKVGYTSYVSTYAYRGLGQGSPGVSMSGGFFRNVVRGRVVDPQGEPIAGAALLIGSDLVFTDSDGRFLLRVKNEKSLGLSVSLDDFTAPGRYVVVSAPPAVKATREDTSQDYEIVVKRVASVLVPSAQ